VGAALGWVVVAFFAVAPASKAVELLANLARRPGLTSSTPFAAAIEALVLLLFAAAYFRVARVLTPPRWYWAVGPLGYLASFGAFVGVMLLLGDTMALPKGDGWAYVALDVGAAALGAWAMAGRRRSEAPGAGE
jgi:hypothetical protein